VKPRVFGILIVLIVVAHPALNRAWTCRMEPTEAR